MANEKTPLAELFSDQEEDPSSSKDIPGQLLNTDLYLIPASQRNHLVNDFRDQIQDDLDRSHSSDSS